LSCETQGKREGGVTDSRKGKGENHRNLSRRVETKIPERDVG